MTESRLIRDLVMRDVKIVQRACIGGSENLSSHHHRWFQFTEMLPITAAGNIWNILQVEKRGLAPPPPLLFAPVRACCRAFRKTDGEGGIRVGFKAPVSRLRDVSLYVRHRTSPKQTEGLHIKYIAGLLGNALLCSRSSASVTNLNLSPPIWHLYRCQGYWSAPW